jgi:hypothetical protein
LEFAIWERAQTSALRRHSSENTSQVVENTYLLLEFSSPGVSARAHLVSSENTLQVAGNTKMPGSVFSSPGMSASAHLAFVVIS